MNSALYRSHFRAQRLPIDDGWVGVDKHTHPSGPSGPRVLPGMHRSYLNNDTAWLVNKMLRTIIEHEDQLSTDWDQGH